MSQVRLSMGCSHIPNHSVHVGGSRCKCEAAASAITAQGTVLTPKKCSTRSVASPQNRQVCGVSTGAKERIRIAVVQAFSHSVTVAITTRAGRCRTVPTTPRIVCIFHSGFHRCTFCKTQVSQVRSCREARRQRTRPVSNPSTRRGIKGCCIAATPFSHITAGGSTTSHAARTPSTVHPSLAQ